MTPQSPRPAAALSEKYSASVGWFYMTGVQALVRLPIQQRLRDASQGWNTGGYISGYRGSPLGRYDMELQGAADFLKQHNIQFRPGLNEDLAATALWGSQYVGSHPGANVDGVFGLWYGKGPGVDRSADALRHANLAGTSPKGGVVALAGDDHGAKSSTVANFSDQVFIAVGMPVLYPSNTQELLDYGLHGIAMSRHSGCWVGMKVVTDVVEGGGSVYVDDGTPVIKVPEYSAAAAAAPGGLGIRPGDMPLPQEERLYQHKLHAALDYARLNALNQMVRNPQEATVGVVAAGKSWQDVCEALDALATQAVGLPAIRLLKIGMIWPLDPLIVRQFAAGLDTLVVVEEKRPVMEEQIRAILYGTSPAPTIVGKQHDASPFDAVRGRAAFANFGELSPGSIARVLAQIFSKALPGCGLLAFAQSPAAGVDATGPMRLPGFCSGCPHNRSTKVPDGSRALAGIGCHTMAMLANPKQTTTVSHMGAEGVMWLGQQGFTAEKHVFANIGDGTYAHSGFLAIRQAVAANVPITYKLLYNGFVAMTGGQPVESGQSPAQILHGLAAEGVKKMALVTDDPERYAAVQLPAGVPVHPRTRMEAVQSEFREYAGVSVILYDQACATERRRLRKRGQWEDPPKRAFINAAVCEGCGDCGKTSNCMSVQPLDTALGRKRRINQDSCNKDFSCVEGFCPSFVTVHGGTVRRASSSEDAGLLPLSSARVPEPHAATLTTPFNVLICGIGGTGVVTIGQTLAVAAHLAGRYSSNLDVTGLAQKYGAVHSHVRFAPTPEQLHATRIAAGDAHVLIGCDLVVAAGAECLSKLRVEQTLAVVDTGLVPTTDFARNPDWHMDAEALIRRVQARLGDRMLALDAARLAKSLLGDAVAANMMMLGAAWQWGRIPLPLTSIERAIELNGVAVRMNQQAFAWGRLAAHDLTAVRQLADKAEAMGAAPVKLTLPQTTASIVRHRSEELRKHTGAVLVDRYQALVARVQLAEDRLDLGERLSRAVAHNYHRLLAVKDEWEVARLFSTAEFRESLGQEFVGPYRLHFHFGIWPFARRDPATGAVSKTEFGPWMARVLRAMSRLRWLRGTWLDPFRFGAERRLDRQWLAEYEGDVRALLDGLTAGNLNLAVQIASLPEKLRGYGHVREASSAIARAHREDLLGQWRHQREVPSHPAGPRRTQTVDAKQ